MIGADTVDAAKKDIPFDVPDSVTTNVPLLGADGYHALANQTPQLAQRLGISETTVDHLLNRYGSLIYEVLAPAKDDKTLLEPIPGAPTYVMAEALYAATHEGAAHLEDILHRRMRLGMEYDHRGVDSAEAVSTLVADAMGWDDKARRNEIEVFTMRVEAQKKAEKELTDEAANKIEAEVVDTRPDVDTTQDR